PVQTHPVWRIELRGLGTCDQRHQFIFAAFGLAQQQGGLLGQWEADLFSADWRGNNSAAFFAALVDFPRISLSRRRLLRGKKPPPPYGHRRVGADDKRSAVSEPDTCPGRWAGYQEPGAALAQAPGKFG